MNADKQRIAIAEACGWTECGIRHPSMSGTGEVVGNRKGTPRGCWAALPNYLTDLNAIHEAEKILDDDIPDPGSKRYTYSCWLYKICPKEQQPCRATATQRAEAFLKTLNLWTDQ